jgi:hypothetical protein
VTTEAIALLSSLLESDGLSEANVNVLGSMTLTLSVEIFAAAKTQHSRKIRTDRFGSKLSQLFERNGAGKRKSRAQYCNAITRDLCDAQNRFCSEALSSDCSLIVLRVTRCCHAYSQASEQNRKLDSIFESNRSSITLTQLNEVFH